MVFNVLIKNKKSNICGTGGYRVKALHHTILIFINLKLSLANGSHNFKWLKIILTSKVDPRTVRVNIFIMAVNP